jgi:hypothetical protein
LEKQKVAGGEIPSGRRYGRFCYYNRLSLAAAACAYLGLALREIASMSFRLYYNRASGHPHIWSIDSGTQESEFCVRNYVAHNVSFRDGKDLSVPLGDKDKPCVRIEIEHAVLAVRDGIAHFYGENSEAL